MNGDLRANHAHTHLPDPLSLTVAGLPYRCVTSIFASDIIAGMSSKQKIVILADTHVGDRTKILEPTLFSAIQKEQPDQIFHAGDVCTREVLTQLETIAPTLAVQGNRDWFLGLKLPKEIRQEVNGVKITLAHGHFSIWHWFWNYVRLFLTRQPLSDRFFQKELAKRYPDADIIIYGHLHYYSNQIMDGKLFLNPGVGYPERRNNYRPGFIILNIEPDRTYSTSLIFTNPEPETTV
jgi:hypothetical protein